MDDAASALVDAFKRLAEDDQARVYNEIDSLWKLKAKFERLERSEDQSASNRAGK